MSEEELSRQIDIMNRTLWAQLNAEHYLLLTEGVSDGDH